LKTCELVWTFWTPDRGVPFAYRLTSALASLPRYDMRHIINSCLTVGGGRFAHADRRGPTSFRPFPNGELDLDGPVSSADGQDVGTRGARGRGSVTGRPSSPWSRAGISLEPRGDLENLAGALHGGVAASLLDNALGAAVVECRQVHGQAARPTKSGMANLLG